MKVKIYFLALLFALALSTSCDNDEIEFQNDFAKSQQTWKDFKKSSNNSYVYKVTGSSWVGMSWETLITVSSGKVIKREFKFTNTGSFPVEPADMEWIENEDQLNSHERSPASDVLTMDQIYAKAKNTWLQERKNASTFFETENYGMISLCGYVPHGCADDCFRGITIESIEAIN